MINQGCNKICEVSPPDLINIDCMHLSILKNVNSWTCGEQMMCLEVTVFGPNPPTMYHGMPWGFSVFPVSSIQNLFLLQSLLWRIKTKKDVTNRYRIRYEICAFFRGKTSKHIALLLVVTVFLSKRVFAVLTMHISPHFRTNYHPHRHIVSYVPIHPMSCA